MRKPRCPDSEGGNETLGRTAATALAFSPFFSRPGFSASAGQASSPPSARTTQDGFQLRAEARSKAVSRLAGRVGVSSGLATFAWGALAKRVGYPPGVGGPFWLALALPFGAIVAVKRLGGDSTPKASGVAPFAAARSSPRETTSRTACLAPGRCSGSQLAGTSSGDKAAASARACRVECIRFHGRRTPRSPARRRGRKSRNRQAGRDRRCRRRPRQYPSARVELRPTSRMPGVSTIQPASEGWGGRARTKSSVCRPPSGHHRANPAVASDRPVSASSGSSCRRRTSRRGRGCGPRRRPMRDFVGRSWCYGRHGDRPGSHARPRARYFEGKGAVSARSVSSKCTRVLCAGKPAAKSTKRRSLEAREENSAVAAVTMPSVSTIGRDVGVRPRGQRHAGNLACPVEAAEDAGRVRFKSTQSPTAYVARGEDSPGKVTSRAGRRECHGLWRCTSAIRAGPERLVLSRRVAIERLPTIRVGKRECGQRFCPLENT